MQTKKVHSAAYNSCLIEIELWDGTDAIHGTSSARKEVEPAE